MKTLALSLCIALSVALVGCGSEEPAEGGCKPASGTICTVVGTGNAGLAPEGTPGTESDLYMPMEVEQGPDGLVYISDWNNHRIRRLGADGLIHTIAGTGYLGDGPPGPALESDFNHPASFTFDALGRLVIAAWHNSRIKRVDLGSGVLEDLCGTGGRAYNGDGGPAKDAILDLPASVAYDVDGNLFILDQANQVVRRIDTAGVIDRYAGNCVIGKCDAGETPQACPGSNRTSCLLDTDPNTGCSQPCAVAFEGDGGPALDARLAQPVGQAADPAGRIAFDGAGNLIFADTKNHRIRKIDPAGVITSIVGSGERGFSGDDGPALDAQLDNPTDVAIADDGTIYIADTNNSCVRAVSPAGTISTVAGRCGERGFEGDGSAPGGATLNRPYGIGLDIAGALYIADTLNHRIRVVTP